MSETNVLTQPPQTIPDHAPGVSMDIELGQRVQPGEVINFNYDEFIHTAKRRGASSDEISSVDIDIIDPSYRPKGVKGTYKPATETEPNITEVVFTGKQEEINETLGHEFEHHLQFQRGTLGESTISKTYANGVKEALRSRKNAIIFGLGAIGTITSVLVGPEVLAAPGIPAMTYGLTRNALGIGYVGNWAEKEARQAQKEYRNSNIITLEQS